MQQFQNIKTLTQREVIITLENKPSSWPEFVGQLARENIDILGYMHQVIGGMLNLRLVVDNPQKLEGWLRQQQSSGKYSFFAHEILLLEAPNEPGALASVSNTLAKSGILPKASYPVVVEGTPMLAFVVDDVNTARKSFPNS